MFMDWNTQHRKDVILSKWISRFNTIKIPTDRYSDIDMLILNFMWKGNGNREGVSYLLKWAEM